MKMKDFYNHIVGKKILMACTGSFLVLFIIVHLLGNSSIYIGPDGINAYTKQLHSMPALVWLFRLVMLALFTLHVFIGIQLYVQNSASKPVKYSVKKSLKATFSSKNMIWTGLLIAAFLTYHLLHFTFRVASAESLGIDALGRPDVYSMVLTGLEETPAAIIYIIGLFALFLHILHGVQSLFQSTGLNCEKIQPCIIKASRTAAVVIFIAYLAIPLVIFAGILRF
jgi:succinate dehydrogenase / fumarate reductase cytochrome b subunit